MEESLITRSKEILSGRPVFSGTRVPVQNLIDYLSTGSTIDEFLDDFPTVSKEQVVSFLEMADERLPQLSIPASPGYRPTHPASSRLQPHLERPPRSR